jgi:tetratricopeptide (TPR) repeat protein
MKRVAPHLPRLLSIALSLITAQAALAQPPPASKGNPKAEARAKAKAQVERAQIEYELGRFDEALAGYTRAFELYPAPALLFNLGQCHRNLKNPERAIFFFEGYLREAVKLDDDRRRLTEDLIAEARGELERQQIAAAVAGAHSPPPLIVPLPTPAPVTAPVVLLDQDRERSRGRTSVAHKWWFWTAIGVATAAAGAVYYATGDPRLVFKSSSVGTLDRR